MPIYEYDCPVCGRVEAIQKISEKPLKECPNCLEKGKHSKVTKMVSQASFHLKGSGWYKTDYGSSENKGATKAKTSTESKDTAKSSETKSDSSDSKAKPPKSCSPGCGCH